MRTWPLLTLALALGACDDTPLEAVNDEPIGGAMEALTELEAGAFLKNTDNLVAHQVSNRAGAAIFAGRFITAAGVRSIAVGATNDTDFGVPAPNTYPSLLKLTPPGTNESEAYAVLEGAPANKIVYAGYARRTDGKRVGVIGRADATGPDETFSGNGFVTGLHAATRLEWNHIIQDTEGRLIVAGYAWYEGWPHLVVARYGKNGEVDSVWGSSGGHTAWKIPFHEVVTPWGEIPAKISGLVRNGSNNDFYVSISAPQNSVLHFRADGKLDTTFGTGGVARWGQGESTGEDLKALTIAENNIYAGGSAGGQVAIAAFQPDGKPLRAWGGTGVRAFPVPNASSSNIASLDYDRELKRLYAGGEVRRTTTPFFLLACFRLDGELDDSFGNQGFLARDFSSQQERVTSISLARVGASRTIMAVGHATDLNVVPNRHRTAIARWEIGNSHIGEPCAYGTCFVGGQCVADECRSTRTQAYFEIPEHPLDDDPSTQAGIEIKPGQKVKVTGWSRAFDGPRPGSPPLVKHACEATDTSVAVFTDPCRCGGEGCVDGVPRGLAGYSNLAATFLDHESDNQLVIANLPVVGRAQRNVAGELFIPFEVEMKLPAAVTKPFVYYKWQPGTNHLRATYAILANGIKLTNKTGPSTFTWKYVVKGHEEMCVKNLEAQFEGIASGSAPESRADITFDSEGRYPPENHVFDELGIKSHLQGLARVPDTNYFVGSRSWHGDGSRGGLFLAQLPVLDPWEFLSRHPGSGSGNGRMREFYPYRWTDHAGSLQAIKSDGRQYVAVGAECAVTEHCGDATYATIFELKMDGNPLQAAEHLNIHDMEGVRDPKMVSSAGIVRLSSGHYLLGVMQNSKFLNFIISEHPWLGHEGNNWRVRNSKQVPEDPFENYQLLTDCGTGNLYGVGLHSPFAGDGKAVLHRLLPRADGTFEVDHINRFIVDDDGSCDLRGAGSMYVDRHGRLALYCADKGDKHWIDFKEWTAAD